MIRTILVGLDGSIGSRTATELGISWAKQCGASLTGVAVVDSVTIRSPHMTGLGGGTYQARIEAARMARATSETGQFVAEFATSCRVAGAQATCRIEHADPVEALLTLHDDFDITLIPKKTRFRFVTQDGPDDTLVQVLRRGRRPVVAVPDVLPEGDSVVVAYDGGMASADALQSFASSGLGSGATVSVVSISDKRETAILRAEEAARFLAFHDVTARPRPVPIAAGHEADALRAVVADVNARMVVMGAFSHGQAREWLRRSTTIRMLQSEERLLYCCHHPA